MNYDDAKTSIQAAKRLAAERNAGADMQLAIEAKKAIRNTAGAAAASSETGRKPAKKAAAKKAATKKAAAKK